MEKLNVEMLTEVLDLTAEMTSWKTRVLPLIMLGLISPVARQLDFAAMILKRMFKPRLEDDHPRKERGMVHSILSLFLYDYGLRSKTPYNTLHKNNATVVRLDLHTLIEMQPKWSLKKVNRLMVNFAGMAISNDAPRVLETICKLADGNVANALDENFEVKCSLRVWNVMLRYPRVFKIYAKKLAPKLFASEELYLHQKAFMATEAANELTKSFFEVKTTHALNLDQMCHYIAAGGLIGCVTFKVCGFREGDTPEKRKKAAHQIKRLCMTLGQRGIRMDHPLHLFVQHSIMMLEGITDAWDSVANMRAMWHRPLFLAFLTTLENPDDCYETSRNDAIVEYGDYILRFSPHKTLDSTAEAVNHTASLEEWEKFRTAYAEASARKRRRDERIRYEETNPSSWAIFE